MPREIKFRGKRIDNGEWVEGYFFASNISGAFILTTKTIKKIRHDGNIEITDRLIEYEVIPETVGQYTGLEDKNGKEICEGDIVSFDISDTDGERCIKEEVRWANQGCAFVPWYWLYECEGCECAVSIKNIEVIGNIHTNPELLEVK